MIHLTIFVVYNLFHTRNDCPQATATQTLQYLAITKTLVDSSTDEGLLKIVVYKYGNNPIGTHIHTINVKRNGLINREPKPITHNQLSSATIARITSIVVVVVGDVVEFGGVIEKES